MAVFALWFRRRMHISGGTTTSHSQSMYKEKECEYMTIACIRCVRERANVHLNTHMRIHRFWWWKWRKYPTDYIDGVPLCKSDDERRYVWCGQIYIKNHRFVSLDRASLDDAALPLHFFLIFCFCRFAAIDIERERVHLPLSRLLLLLQSFTLSDFLFVPYGFATTDCFKQYTRFVFN